MLIITIFFRKIVLIAVQDSGSKLGRSGLYALKQFNSRVRAVYRGSLALFGYIGRSRRRYSGQIVQRNRYKGPSVLTANGYLPRFPGQDKTYNSCWKDKLNNCLDIILNETLQKS